MLQRVSINVADTELAGVLHLPDEDVIGGCAVLHGYGGHPDQPHIVATCEALAAARVAALRFGFRGHRPPRMSMASALADAAAAIRFLKTHPSVRDPLAIAGFSFGGTVAAITAGRDHRIRAAVLAAAPTGWSDGEHEWKAVAELSHTRARVLLVWGTRDTKVAFESCERYVSVLSQARVTNRVVKVDGADHDFDPAAARERMTAEVATWVRESFGPRV